MDDADALASGAGLVHLGHIHRVGDIAVLEVVADLLRGHDGAVVLRFRGGRAQMRRADDARTAQQGLGGEVGHVAGHLAGVEGLQQGVGVDQLAAGIVQQLDTVFAEGQRLGVDGVLGGGQIGHMDGDVVAERQHIVQVDAVVDLTAQIPRSIDGDVGVVAVDLHAQLDGTVGDAGADGTQTDDAEGLALDLVAHELLLALLYALCHGGISGKALRPLGSGGHVAAACDEHSDDQLGHGVGVGAGGVEDHDALLTAPVEGDVVNACTGAGDGQQTVVEGSVQQVSAADEDAVRGVSVHRHVEEVLVQLCQTHRADGVQGFYRKHWYFILFLSSFCGDNLSVSLSLDSSPTEGSLWRREKAFRNAKASPR